MPAPHKLVLKEILDRFTSEVDRLEAVAVRLERLEPPTALLIPTDPAAQKAADDMVALRRAELLGEDAPYE